MFSSRLTAFFRRRGVAVTDRRVQKMNEILNSIKFIKMNAWVKAFANDVHSTYSPERTHLVAVVTEVNSDCLLSGIRDEERRILELTGYCQSVTVGVAPVVVVIASVATFSAHILLGYDLTAAQVPNYLWTLRSAVGSLDNSATCLSVSAGLHCGDGVQRHDLRPEGHTVLCQISVGGIGGCGPVQGATLNLLQSL